MTIIKLIFTAFVIALIVLPIPPSTIIGLAIIANPKTNKHLDDRAIAVVMGVMKGFKLIALWKFNLLARHHQNLAMKYVR
jgi:hypothetical protein